LLFIDTGAFLARYIQSDGFHNQANKLWSKIEKKGLHCVTSNFVLDELATLLFRRTYPKFAESRMINIYNSTSIEIIRPSREDELFAISLMKKFSDHEISFTDCISFSIMKKKKLSTAFSFDRHFSIAGFLLYK
jgi:hypothetical protein